jgi:hypothetical protein
MVMMMFKYCIPPSRPKNDYFVSILKSKNILVVAKISTIQLSV